MFLKRQEAFGLEVGMVGVKLGDRFLQIGCPHGGRLGAIAAKVGLSGRAVVVVPDETSAERARKGAADAGVLIEVGIAPPTTLSYDADSFDVVVADDTGGLFGSLSAANRAAAIREVRRVLRPGGRAMVLGGAQKSGLGKLFGGAPPSSSFGVSGEANTLLDAEGFILVRTLAERDGLTFVEGVKPRE
jgi:ubiquinone/menaquinone biosynthesis C-methylase UbiE